VSVLPLSGSSVGGLTALEIVALVNGLVGGQPGNFVLLEGTGQNIRNRLWLRYYRAGCMSVSFGFSRCEGRIRVAIQGLDVLGLRALREPEFDNISAALDAVEAVVKAMNGLADELECERDSPG
jgi:hypothetical protein